MKPFRTIILLAALAPLAHSAPPPAAAPPVAAPPTAEPLKPAAPVELATVDGTPITTADVEQALRMRYGPQLDSMPPQQRAMAIKQSTPQMAQELIARTLLLNAAKAAKVEVDPAKIKETIDSIKGSLPPQMSFADYAKTAGLTEESFTAQIAEELQISGHVEARLETLPKITDEAVAKFYEENKAKYVVEESVQASHILIKTDPAAGEEGKKAKRVAIDKLRAQLIAAKGEGFDKVAMEHSECPSGAKGGDLGTFGRGQMVAEFDKAVFTQKPGEIGEVIETQFGFHIIKVIGKTEAGQQTLEQVKEAISERLDTESKGDAVQSYLDDLEKAAKITRTDALKPPAPPAPAPAPAPGE